jgi:hypothetical protein
LTAARTAALRRTTHLLVFGDGRLSIGPVTGTPLTHFFRSLSLIYSIYYQG